MKPAKRKKPGVMEKRRHKLFMTRTAACYRSLVKRSISGKLDFDLGILRQMAQHALDRGTCFYCLGDLKIKTFSVDHKTPLSRGGGSSIRNLAICCVSCNKCKGSMTEMEFKALMAVLNTFEPKVRNEAMGRMKAGASIIRLQFLRR